MAAAHHRISTAGLVLGLAGVTCLLAAATAYQGGQPRAIPVLALVAGGPAVLAAAVDLGTEYTPSPAFHLVLGIAALAGAALAVPGRYYVTIVTLAVAGLVGLGWLWERR